MKIARIVSVLLMGFIVYNIQSMHPLIRVYVPLEERVLNNDLSIDQYLLALENVPRYGNMLKKLRQAYYSRIPNLYGEFVEEVSYAVALAKTYENVLNPLVIRGLHNSVRESILRLYGQLSDAAANGYAILGNGS